MSHVDRRSFLRGGIAASAAALSLPSFFAKALWAGETPAASLGDRILVLIQLDGGNDGLNTVVPFGDDLYYKARPGIGIGAGQVVRLGSEKYVGLHPGLERLKGIWESGGLGVLQGIGYPNPNRSHFTSTDIWHTGSVTPPARWNGWLGRSLDCCAQGDVPGLQLDGGPLSLALVGEKVVVPSVADAGRFRVPAGTKHLLEQLVERPREGSTLEYVRRSASQAYATAGRVESALASGKGEKGYPQSELARRLWQIARMIEAGMPARVYAVRLGGFDTHSRQRAGHDSLMRTLGDAVAAFHEDLGANAMLDRTLIMTYSEFGRRLEENRSLGTDHGAAAPLFVLGGGVKGGLHGSHPSLSDLEDGDLRFHTDFRQIYTTILERCLGVDAKQILGAAYAPVPFL